MTEEKKETEQEKRKRTPALSLEERIAKAREEERIKKERRQKLEAIARTKDKAKDTRSKILLGSYLINKIIKLPTLLLSEKENILSYLQSEEDKKLIEEHFLKIEKKIANKE